MGKIYIYLSAILFVFAGCSDNRQEFPIAIEQYSSDSLITEEEFETLRLLAESTAGLENLAEKSALYNYVTNYLYKVGIQAEVWNPKPAAVLEPFNVNVYLENSASMNGYVEGVTDFESTIYGMLGDIKTSDICDSLNLNYINNEIPFTKNNAAADDLRDFIQKLEPTTFKQRGGNRGNSDIADVIKTVLSKTDSNNVTILISDFIFSPGSKNNGQDYLNNQKVGLQISLKEKLKSEDIAIAIYQLESNFKGFYYDYRDNPTKFEGRRPYYIWIMGTENQIKSLLDLQVIKNSDKGLLNRIVFKDIAKKDNLAYKVLRNYKKGNFDIDPSGRSITKAAVEGKDFAFSIAVNFANSLIDQNYYTDDKNYLISKNYALSVRELSEDERSSPSLKGFTHLITVSTDRLVSDDISIKVIAKTPSWIYDHSSNDDSSLVNDSEEQKKTFGLNFLIEGVSNAFYPHPDVNKNLITELNISIKK